MKARIYKEQDYPTICKWWDKYDTGHISTTLLSDLGLIVEDKKGDICAAWLYETNSPFLIVAWHVADKDASEKRKSKALDTLMKASEVIAKDAGYEVVSVFLNIDKIINKMENLGYIKGDLGMTNLNKKL